MLEIPTLKNPDAKSHLSGALILAPGRAVLCLFLLSGLMLTIPSSVSGTQSVTVAWNSVTGANVASYKVFYGSASRNYTNVTSVGNVTNATISGLKDGATYYFATTTLSTSGLESSYSSEISYTAPTGTIISKKVTANITNAITLLICTNLISPTWWPAGTFAGSTNLSFPNLPVVLIRGVCSNLTGSVTLNWPASTDPLLVGYKVYYGTTSGVYPYVLSVGKVRTVTISNLSQGKVYYFLVDTYNIAGLISLYLNEISATVPVTSFTLSIGY